jgi:uncharacterized protein YbaR (Trm112 family)
MRILHHLLLVSMCFVFPGCGSETDRNNTDGKMVFVDTETMTAVVAGISDAVPAVHPGTGKRTLMPGLYCPHCKKWYPAPAPEQINRQPGAALCPRTKTPLVVDGPWPQEQRPVTGEN